MEPTETGREKGKNFSIFKTENYKIRLLVKRNVPFPSISLNIPYFSPTKLSFFFIKKSLKIIPCGMFRFRILIENKLKNFFLFRFLIVPCSKILFPV